MFAHMLQGLTVYRALKYSHAKLGNWVVLPGAGGGLGHLGVFPTIGVDIKTLTIRFGNSDSICGGYGSPRCSNRYVILQTS